MPPNIVLFMTDQLRRDALGCYGNEICKTPNLDRLAAEGTQFDQAYTVSPVCSPSRASLMSGLYPHNHGVMINTHIAPAWCRGLSLDTGRVVVPPGDPFLAMSRSSNSPRVDSRLPERIPIPRKSAIRGD